MSKKDLSSSTETKLKEWIISNRILGVCIDGTTIKSKAKEFYKEIYLSDTSKFLASCGYFVLQTY